VLEFTLADLLPGAFSLPSPIAGEPVRSA